MQDLDIENGVPVPDGSERYRNSRAFIPWGKMEVGDSVKLEASFVAKRAKNYAYNAVYEANQRHAPKVFQAARADDGSIRIWRVE